MDSNTPKSQLSAAVSAARAFKQLLDMQAPNTLFFPRHKGDARTTATYAHASLWLEQASQELKCPEGTHMERRLVLPVVNVIPDQSAGVPTNQLQLVADIVASTAQLVIQVLEEHAGRGEHRGLLEIVARFGSETNLSLEQVESKRDAVHEGGPEKVDEQSLCHGAADNQEGR